MKIGAMFGDILTSLFKRPVTERYPFERKPNPERLRGKVVWDPEKCTGCMLCMKDCPAGAIELITLDKVNKRFVMRYNAEKCVYCAQCEVTCRFNCLNLSNEQWEMASTKREPFTVYYGKEEDIHELMETIAKRDSGKG